MNYLKTFTVGDDFELEDKVNIYAKNNKVKPISISVQKDESRNINKVVAHVIFEKINED